MTSKATSASPQGCKSNTPSHRPSKSLKFILAGRNDRVLEGLRHLRDSSLLLDVTLVAEGQEFPAHRVMLASCSDYFRAMFTGDLRESTQQRVVMHGVSAKALEVLLHYVYESEIRFTKEIVIEVLSGAIHVQFLEVVSTCVDYLTSHLSLENCSELELIGDLYSLKELQQQVHCFICEHWIPLSSRPEFLELTVEQLKRILQSDFPVYCAEVEVVKALLAWLSHDIPQRLPFLSEVMGLVRRDNLRHRDMEELQSCPEAQSIMAACSKLSSLLAEMSVGDKIEIEGVINTRGYFETVLVVGGLHRECQKTITNTVMYLDVDTPVFKQFTTIPHMEQSSFGLEVLDNYLYVVGGCTLEENNDLTHPFCFRLDTSTKIWTLLPAMSQERGRHYLGALNGMLYAVGGEVDNSEPLFLCEVFDPVHCEWSSISSLPAARSELAGTSLGGKLYVSGGLAEGLQVVKNDMWCYDPDLDSWTACAPLLQPRADHTMLTFRGRIYALGGWRWEDMKRTAVDSVDRYCAETNRWETVQHMSTPRKYCAFALHQGKVYVIGGCCDYGQDLKRVTQLDVLDLETMQWSPNPVTLSPVVDHSAVFILLPRKV